jgi:hypothetical protein
MKPVGIKVINADVAHSNKTNDDNDDDNHDPPMALDRYAVSIPEYLHMPSSHFLESIFLIINFETSTYFNTKCSSGI